MYLADDFNRFFIEEEKIILNTFALDFPDNKEELILKLDFYGKCGVEEMKEFYDSLIEKIREFSDEKFEYLKKYVPLSTSLVADDLIDEDFT